MNLEQARAALAAAHHYDTADYWKAAALALAAVADKPKRARKPESSDIHDTVWTGKRPALHVARCTLANGYSVRVSIGQAKGETVRDTLARMERFTLACYRAEHLCVRPVRRDDSGVFDYLPCRPWADGARLLHGTPDVVELRIVRWAFGPDADRDLEELPALAVAA